MKVSDKIYINLDQEKIDSRVIDILTYENPEYFQKMNMGITVRGVPKKIQTYQIKDRQMEIFRGEALKIKPFFLTPYTAEFYHQDHPVSIQYINNDFPLDKHQEGAVAAMVQYRQGVIHAVTSAGKSLIICKAAAEIGQRTLIIVHRKVLVEQLLEDINKYIRNEKGEPIKVGLIGSGKSSIGDITIAIDKSLSKHLSTYSQEFGTVILDECHLAPAATMLSLLNNINSKKRFGLSGTLRRKDQKEFLIFSTFGPVIHTINKEELLELGRVVPVEAKILESETMFDWDHVVEALTEQGERNPTMKARHLQEKTIANDPRRNDMIIDQVKRLYDTGQKTIILCRYVEPCTKLKNALETRFGIEAGIITGKDSKEALESYSRMKHGDLKVIFATIGCVSTGVSISDLDNIVLISPMFTNELLLKQIVGRLMRTAKGKTHGTLYYVYDQNIFPNRKLRNFLKIINE